MGIQVVEHILIMNAGMNDYLSKPIDVQLLYVKLVRWINKESVPLAPNVVNRRDDLKTTRGLPEIDGLDTRSGMIVCNNNSDLYRRLLEKFIKNETFVDEFRHAIERG